MEIIFGIVFVLKKAGFFCYVSFVAYEEGEDW